VSTPVSLVLYHLLGSLQRTSINSVQNFSFLVRAGRPMGGGAEGKAGGGGGGGGGASMGG
jgi:hypothetical protein